MRSRYEKGRLCFDELHDSAIVVSVTAPTVRFVGVVGTRGAEEVTVPSNDRTTRKTKDVRIRNRDVCREIMMCPPGFLTSNERDACLASQPEAPEISTRSHTSTARNLPLTVAGDTQNYRQVACLWRI